MDLFMLKLEKLDISDVRKSLFEIRERFKKEEEPIYLSDTLSNGMTLEEFCYRFSLASHIRRHQKSNTFKSRQNTDDLCDSPRATQNTTAS